MRVVHEDGVPQARAVLAWGLTVHVSIPGTGAVTFTTPLATFASCPQILLLKNDGSPK